MGKEIEGTAETGSVLVKVGAPLVEAFFACAEEWPKYKAIQAILSEGLRVYYKQQDGWVFE